MLCTKMTNTQKGDKWHLSPEGLLWVSQLSAVEPGSEWMAAGGREESTPCHPCAPLAASATSGTPTCHTWRDMSIEKQPLLYLKGHGWR